MPGVQIFQYCSEVLGLGGLNVMKYLDSQGSTYFRGGPNISKYLDRGGPF